MITRKVKVKQPGKLFNFLEIRNEQIETGQVYFLILTPEFISRNGKKNHLCFFVFIKKIIN